MNYLSIENISKSFGERVLFENISFGISKGQKIAFIAKNGTGKTTLLNIIADSESSDTGQVVKRKGLKISYLSQKMDLNPNLTVEQSIFNTDNPILKVIESYEKAIDNSHDSETYQIAFDQMEQYNAWDFETQYKQILYKLKLENLQQKVDELSGGQQKRLSLAICLLQSPDLLILDEPTNHLDLEMIEWLEIYFQKEKITLFMVTHDRYFLERVCNDIIELYLSDKTYCEMEAVKFFKSCYSVRGSIVHEGIPMKLKYRLDKLTNELHNLVYELLQNVIKHEFRLK